jgi:membrane-bound lytic murein transglycosylase B
MRNGPVWIILAGSLLLAGCAAQPAPITFAEQAPLPPSVPAGNGQEYQTVVDADWAQQTAAATGIPLQAVIAYAQAAAATEVLFPGCGIGWNTLAGIGLIESDHGRHGGSSIGEDGRVTPPIYGVALDGDGVALVPDTDGGEFDGDAELDRAIGPMQIIPDTWRSWHIDASGDSVPDPQNIRDSALAASNHLCRSSGWDMVSPDGWRAGIAGYNAGQEYLRDVAEAAQRYLDESR